MPLAGRSRAVVRVRCAAVNPKDVLVRKGKFSLFTGRRFPIGVGYDFSGVLESDLPAAGLHAGDAVFGMLNGWRGATYAEYVAVPPDELAAKPPTLDWPLAAAIPLAAQTALQALRDLAHVTSGSRVLINGASGGVGTFAIQIAKALGAHVATVTSARNQDLCRGLGADETTDYETTDVCSLRTRFDAFFDVFGNRPFPSVRHLLTPRGMYVSTVPHPALFALSLATLVTPKKARLVIVRSRRCDLDTLSRYAADGRLRPTIDRSFNLGDAPKAHAFIETKRARGKVVLQVSS